MTFIHSIGKAQKQLVGSLAIAGLFWVGVPPMPARAASYTANIQCGNQGWILQSDQAPGVTNPKSKLISQGNALNGTYIPDSKTYVFNNAAYEYQVMLGDSGTADLRILDRKTGTIIEEEQCTRDN